MMASNGEIMVDKWSIMGNNGEISVLMMANKPLVKWVHIYLLMNNHHIGTE